MDHMHEIPALIVACYDYEMSVDGVEIYRKAGSVWPGIQNLLLTARSLGLGATPTTLALRDQEAVRTALNLPESFAALCLLPVGYPMGRFGPVTRKPVDTIMRFDRWS
jgi:nitroreductase